jgi:hypothetical protein
MPSVWLQIMTAKTQSSLSNKTWNTLKQIAEKIYYLEYQQGDTIHKRASRLIKILGHDSWEKIQKIRDDVKKDIFLITSVQKKLINIEN